MATSHQRTPTNNYFFIINILTMYVKDTELNNIANAFFGGSIADKLAANAKAPVVDTRKGEHLNCEDACCNPAEAVAEVKLKTNAGNSVEVDGWGVINLDAYPMLSEEEIQQSIESIKAKALKPGKQRISWNIELVTSLLALRRMVVKPRTKFKKNHANIPFYCLNCNKEHEISISKFLTGRKCGKCRGFHKSTEEMRDFFLANGYVPDKEWVYKDVDTYYPMFCIKGNHRTRISVTSIRSNRGCLECRKAGNYKPFKYKADDIRKEFAEAQMIIPEGWKYAGYGAPIPFHCLVCGNDHQIDYGHFKDRGQRCGFCARNYKPESEIRAEYLAEGYVVPSEWNFNRQIDKIPFTCNKCGNDHAISYSNFKTGTRCAFCRLLERGHAKSDYIRNLFFDAGLIAPNNWRFQGSRVPIPFVCKAHGHEYEISWFRFNQKPECPKCSKAYEKTQEIREAFSYAGLVVREYWEYVDDYSIISYYCKKEEEWFFTTWQKFKQHQEDPCHSCRSRESNKDRTQIIRECLVAHDRTLLVDNIPNAVVKFDFACNVCGLVENSSWDLLRKRRRWKCKGCRTAEIRAEFEQEDMIVNTDWVLARESEHIPFHCLRCGKDHSITYKNFEKGRRCGNCWSKDSLGRHVYYRQNRVKGLILIRVGAVLKKNGITKSIRDNVLTLVAENLDSSTLEQLAEFYNSRREGLDQVDHIVPFVFFDCSDYLQVIAASTSHNFRMSNATANMRRQDFLTVTEIKLFFHDPELRKLYNKATNYEKKIEHGLPLTLPEAQQEFEMWCKATEASLMDKNRFARWYDLLEQPEKSI